MTPKTFEKIKERTECKAYLRRRHRVQAWRIVETAACDYAKSRTLEAADRMYQAVYGVLPGDGKATAESTKFTEWKYESTD